MVMMGLFMLPYECPTLTLDRFKDTASPWFFPGRYWIRPFAIQTMVIAVKGTVVLSRPLDRWNAENRVRFEYEYVGLHIQL